MFFGKNVAISGKTVVVEAPGKYNGNGIDKVEMYAFLMCFGETWIEGGKVTANDGESNYYFGGSISTSGDMLLVGAYGKDGDRGNAYEFFLAGDLSWD